MLGRLSSKMKSCGGVGPPRTGEANVFKSFAEISRIARMATIISSTSFRNVRIAKSVCKLSCGRHLLLWKGDYNDQTWIVVGEQNFSAVQIRNGCYETEAKTISLC